jgi:hypothetical protein
MRQMSAGSRTDVGSYHRDDNAAGSAHYSSDDTAHCWMSICIVQVVNNLIAHTM